MLTSKAPGRAPAAQAPRAGAHQPLGTRRRLSRCCEGVCMQDHRTGSSEVWLPKKASRPSRRSGAQALLHYQVPCSCGHHATLTPPPRPRRLPTRRCFARTASRARLLPGCIGSAPATAVVGAVFAAKHPPCLLCFRRLVPTLTISSPRCFSLRAQAVFDHTITAVLFLRLLLHVLLADFPFFCTRYALLPLPGCSLPCARALPRTLARLLDERLLEALKLPDPLTDFFRTRSPSA